MLFVIHFQPARANFLETITDEEGQVIAAHFSYLTKLQAKGILKMAGRREDGDFGIAVIEAASDSEAQALFAADPVIEKKVFRGTVGAFRLALGDFK